MVGSAGVSDTRSWPAILDHLAVIVVTVVGFAQGGWAPLLIVFAIEAGVAVLIAAAIVVPLVHRLAK